MVLLKLFILTLTFYQLIVVLDAHTCPKGQKRTRGGAQPCEDCPEGYFYPTDNIYFLCNPCTKCNSKYGSAVRQSCTKETDTICRCRGEFVPSEDDSSTCKCNKGFGLKSGGPGKDPECSKCENGYFSTAINSPCRKWKECKSGVKTAGSNTADVVCNPESTSNPSVSTTSTSNKIVSLTTRLTSLRPTPRMNTTTTTTTTPTSTTTATQGHRVPPTSKGKPSQTPDTATYIGPGMILLTLGIIGLLILTAVTCKLNITPQPAVPQKDSLCRRPVEESGDGSLSSLKGNPVE